MAGSPKKRARKDVKTAIEAADVKRSLNLYTQHPLTSEMDLHGALTRPAPPHWDTPEARQLVIEWVVAGIEQTKIADYLGVTIDQLRYRYRVELDTATSEIVGRVSTSLTQKALSGDVQAQLGFLRHRGGDAWREKKTLDINQTNTVDMKGALVDRVLDLLKPQPKTIDVTPEKDK